MELNAVDYYYMVQGKMNLCKSFIKQFLRKLTLQVKTFAFHALVQFEFLGFLALCNVKKTSEPLYLFASVDFHYNTYL